MAIEQPKSTDFLDSPDHSKSHRVIGVDSSAPDRTFTIDSSGNALFSGAGTVNVGKESYTQDMNIWGNTQFTGAGYAKINSTGTAIVKDFTTMGSYNATLDTYIYHTLPQSAGLIGLTTMYDPTYMITHYAPVDKGIGFEFYANVGTDWDGGAGGSPWINFFASYANQKSFFSTSASAGLFIQNEDVAGEINILANKDLNDYIQFKTVSNVPEITTVGTCDLKITSSSGTIDFDDEIRTGTGAIVGNSLTLNNTSEPALTISMTGITGTDNQAIDIIGGEALGASEDWTGIRVKPDDLDPSGANTRIRGIALNLSGIDTTNIPDNLIGLRIKMPSGLTGIARSATDAIYIEEGDIDHNFSVPATAGAHFTAYDMVIDSGDLHPNSEIHAFDISTSNGAPSGDVCAIGTHTYIAPICQDIGSYTSPSQTEYAGRKTGGGANWVDGIDGSEIFVQNSDEIYVGSTSQFSEIQVIMTIDATRSVIPTLWYNTAADTWTQFYPSDATDGFQQSGLVHWALGDISGSWTNDGDPGGAESSAGYWIKIIRTSAPDPGTPTPTTVKTGVVVSYGWDKDGDLEIRNITSTGAIDFGGGTLEIPNSATPTVNVTGRIAYHTDDNKIIIFDGANTRALPTVKPLFQWVIDGGGSAITTGSKYGSRIPSDCKITGWHIYADISGSIVLDVWKDVEANYPPTVADTIAGTEKPTLSSAIKASDTSLSSMTTTWSAGDYVYINVDSATTVTWVKVDFYGYYT